VTSSRRYTDEIKVPTSDIVFVGYGIVAPEYHWDDYKGVDVKGKTILMLVNDPPIPDPNDPSKLDDNMFKGKAMTYYGRWTYKYEIASEKGAAAALIIHETGPAGYPFEVVGSRHGREDFDIQKPDKNMSRVPVEGWITYDRAAELCKMAGQDLAALKKSAVSKDFRPVALDAKASFDIRNTLREVDSHNVIAKLEGSDPQMKNQYVIYSAHWDHLGKDTSLKGDQIFNGALDNASGTAGLLELAQAFTRISPAPKRSILFLSVTAEERGLLGSKYYAENPLYPLKDTLADINMDVLEAWGRTKDVSIVGLGNSTLEDITAEVAKSQGRVITGDPEPEKGHYYRSDHFEFAKQGVPAIHAKGGVEVIGKPEGYGLQKQREYTTNDYHKVSDEVKAGWDLSGAVEDLQMLLQVGYKVAEADKFPEWKPGTEFKAKRDAMVR
jgi:Zn-dependent M28 family amino/carboxypeptidase